MPGKTEAMPDGIAGDPGTAVVLRHRSPVPAVPHERRNRGGTGPTRRQTGGCRTNTSFGRARAKREQDE